MDNPFVALGEAVHEGFAKLHKRADDVAAEARDKVDVIASEIKAEVLRVEEALGDRIAKLEAMFTPEAISAVTEKLASVGGSVKAVEAEPRENEGDKSEIPAGRSGPDLSIHDVPLQLAGTPSPDTPVASPAVDAPDAPSKAAEIAASVGAAEEHVAPAVEAHDDAVTNGSTPEVAHAEAQAAAAQAGAEPEDAVRIADGVAGHGVVAEVQPVV